jgi:diguanylate cyclase (GGDEF)-like protein/PAS domain S-box-containing protein
MVTTWVVVLEAADADGGEIDVDVVERLLEAVAEADPVALYNADRYALQLSVASESAPEALLTAIALWRSAARRTEAPLWELARAEVITQAEFERERSLLDDGASVLQTGDEALEALLEEAFHDALTGLASPGVFHDRIERAVASGRTTAVLLVDIDNLSALNDRLGLAAGDEVLMATARRLNALLRPGDLVARLGGDSFGLALDDSSREAALAVAERVVAGASRPLLIDGDSVAVTVSIGVAVAEPSHSAAELLRNSRDALSVAKSKGGDTKELFSRPGRAAEATLAEPEVEPVPAQTAYVTLLERVAAAANEHESLEGAARVALRQVCAHTGWPVGHLAVRSPAKDAFEPSSLWHVDSPARFQWFCDATGLTVLEDGEGLPAAAAAEGKPVWVADLTNADPRRADAAHEVGLTAAVALPVLVGDDVVAVLEFFVEHPVEPNATLLDALGAVGTQLGRVVERVRSQEALLETEERLREAQAVGRLGSWHYDIATDTLTVAPEVYAIYGIDPGTAEASMEQFMPLLHADDDALVREHGRLTLDEGMGAEYELRIVRPGGALRWVSARHEAVRDASGAIVAVRGTIHDVTERRLAEETVRQSEARWRRLLEHSVDLICLLDRDGTVISAMGPEIGMTGTRVANAVGVNMRGFIHPVDAARVEPIWDHVLRTPGRSGPFEMRVINAGGGWRWVEGVFNNLLDDDDVGAVVINARDVTDRKWAEEQVAQNIFPS